MLKHYFLQSPKMDLGKGKKMRRKENYILMLLHSLIKLLCLPEKLLFAVISFRSVDMQILFTDVQLQINYDLVNMYVIYFKKYLSQFHNAKTFPCQAHS